MFMFMCTYMHMCMCMCMCTACAPHAPYTASALHTASSLHECAPCSWQVLDTLHFTYDSIGSADDRVMNVLIMLGMALVFKVHG